LGGVRLDTTVPAAVAWAASWVFNSLTIDTAT
jgi:hypothetical protein